MMSNIEKNEIQNQIIESSKKMLKNCMLSLEEIMANLDSNNLDHVAGALISSNCVIKYFNNILLPEVINKLNEIYIKGDKNEIP